MEELEGIRAERLCKSLLQAETERDVIKLLKNAGVWSDPQAWRPFGDNENNYSIIGNQQGNPIAAIVEKFVNSIDAVLMRECYLRGLDPEGSDAPPTITQALEDFFEVKQGNLANISASRRNKLAKNIGFVATGQKQKPNYIIFDLGEGQTPEMMPDTLLSLSKSNKLRIPFVQGKFNMGGTGVLQFCGQNNFQLIISRRSPQVAQAVNPSDSTANQWGFTIVRREAPSQGRRNSMFTYLAPKGRIPSFHSQAVQIPGGRSGAPQLPSLEWGTIIKLFEYDMKGAKSHIRLEFYNKASLLLTRPGLPIRLFECRNYEDPVSEVTLFGLHVRLEEDRRGVLEEGFPTHDELNINGERLRVSIYVFRKDRAKEYREDEGVIFTVNGQSQGFLPRSFFSKQSVGMAYLADSIFIIVDCDNISTRAREDLFMNSRDRLRRNEFRSTIERELEEIIGKHPGLRELKERRRREEIEGHLAQAKPLRDTLEQIIKKSPALATFLVQGKDISNPFKSRLVGEQQIFEGKRFPSFFRLKKGEEKKTCHINMRFRVQFETDVVNDYFGRDERPGRFTLHVNGHPHDNYKLNLWNGIATLTVTLPIDAQIGQTLYCKVWVADDTLVEPFYSCFERHISDAVESKGGTAGRRLPPAGVGEGDRQIPDTLGLPNVVEVRMDEWKLHGFDRYSALRVVDSGDSGYDFYVNIDNVYLGTEIKNANGVDVHLLKTQFEYGMVLLGLALIKDYEESHKPERRDNSSGFDEESPEDFVFRLSKSVAPILLPLMKLSELQVEVDEDALEQTEII